MLANKTQSHVKKKTMMKRINSKLLLYHLYFTGFSLLILSGCNRTVSNKSDSDVTISDNVVVSASIDVTVSDEMSGEKSSADKEVSAGKEISTDGRITFSDGFYYESLSDSVKKRIRGISYQDNPDISYEDLRYLSIKYINFENTECEGELICHKAIAQDLVEIFYELYQASYPIERIELIDNYEGDDTQSMLADNTSCFNYRKVSGSSTLSQHAYGLAIDLNPFYNPYIKWSNGTVKVEPAGSEAYTDRTADFRAKISHEDLAYRLFTSHNFTWGGDWKRVKDYQHFEKDISQP